MSENAANPTTSGTHSDSINAANASSAPVNSIYAAKLMCRSAPNLNGETLLGKVKERFPEVEFTEQAEKRLFCFIHNQHTGALSDGNEVTPMTIVCPAEMGAGIAEFEPALNQLWGRFSDAREILSDCKAAILVSDLMANHLDQKTRFHLFHNLLSCVIRAFDCSVVYLMNSETLLKPDEYLKTFAKPDVDKFFSYGVSVRLFRIQDREDEMVMDTLGLAALNLPDMQCHFRKLQPLKVAQLLYNLAYYIFENGDVISDGSTTSGLNPSDHWVCRHEKSLVAPDRIVLDVNPGPDFAAGARDIS